MTLDSAVQPPGPRVVEQPRFSSSPFEPSDPPIGRLEDVDLTDAMLFTKGDPHSAWKLMREQAPVFWNSNGVHGTGDKGFWAVTNYEGCAQVHRQPQLFSNTDTPFPDFMPLDIPMMLSSMDPPRHTQYRMILQKLFTPKGLTRFGDLISNVVTNVLDAASVKDEFDFVESVAAPMPFAITSALLGIEPGEMQKLAFDLASLDYGKVEAVTESAQMVMDAAEAVTRRHPEGPPGSLLEAVLAGKVDGEPISLRDALGYIWVLFIGGLDTTTHAASMGLLSLFHHPEQFASLRRDHSLLPSAIEEILRWTTPAILMKHRVMADTVLQGVELSEGDYVGSYFPSANRDETAFPDPYTFDIRRENTNQIMTFGWGPHLCLGRHLGRMELQVLFQQILDRFPNIEQAGPAVRSEAFTLIISPLRQLPVRIGNSEGIQAHGH